MVAHTRAWVTGQMRGHHLSKTVSSESTFRLYRTGYFGRVSYHLPPKTTIPEKKMCAHITRTTLAFLLSFWPFTGSYITANHFPHQHTKKVNLLFGEWFEIETEYLVRFWCSGDHWWFLKTRFFVVSSSKKADFSICPLLQYELFKQFLWLIQQ